MLVTIAIVGLIAATVASAAFVLAPRMAPGRLIFDVTPDAPRPFGYGMAWLAVRTRDAARLIGALGLSAVERANWNTGLGTIYSNAHGEGLVFVSPPVNGWTLVVGLALPQPLGKSFVDKATPFLAGLGAEFIEVHYYLAAPGIDHFAWVRVLDGKIGRAFAIGDKGVTWSSGRATREEKALGLKLFEVRRRRGGARDGLVMMPTEAHVMQVAAKWSLDPTRVNEAGAGVGLGWIGRAPTDWRSMKLRNTA